MDNSLSSKLMLPLACMIKGSGNTKNENILDRRGEMLKRLEVTGGGEGR